MIKIEEIKKEQLDAFIDYFNFHLSENGKGKNPIFQPLSQEQSILTEEWKEKFEIGLIKNFGEIGWRKLWIATTQENQIVGHIDIRSYNELNTSHRVLLGMGVDSNFRKLKIGQKMLEFVIAYCRKQPKISWLDLQVMTLNTPAIGLYKKMEFQILTNTIDRFRINNVSYDYTSMTLNVEGN
ncbi:GNAT family N-acetyltransferase [Xanthovirga aplysinae]|uniref:GNAT family N-acetyltransferase n=1 Tax=Xanthovirga aplysinae TaxID=2529853 RepID=UPI0012BC0A5B|nr:GNAT family N-acetyltransferase [Xanthovirga aplysinae]MTI29519.1 GNAT family N-acetyltransferase [Xanthovirga aplysinae]